MKAVWHPAVTLWSFLLCPSVSIRNKRITNTSVAQSKGLESEQARVPIAVQLEPDKKNVSVMRCLTLCRSSERQRHE